MESFFRPARSFIIRSALPISAGLGSSAAFSVSLASALLYVNSHLPLPSKEAKIPIESANLVNSWAFIGEKVIHGNPSGVDNTVSTLGGAIAFSKAVKGREGSLEVLSR